MPEFRCGVLGRGGVAKRSFPWFQANFPEIHQWGEEYLPHVWKDFSNGQDGIIMSLWDASRQLYFGRPETLRPDLAKFLGPGRNFAKWGYFPIDSTGPDEVHLPIESAQAVMGYDRVLAASEWGRDVLSGHRQDADWIPHMIWTKTFRPVENARTFLGIDSNAIVVGVNMANQARKDWPVAFEAAAILKRTYGNRLRLWFHSDMMIRHYNLYALAHEYGVADCLEVTLEKTDKELALRYSACDVTMLPSAGEGWGFPIAESLACGVGCIVTDYAAGQELVFEEHRVMPVTYKIDTIHCVRRAVLSGWSFARAAEEEIERRLKDPVGHIQRMVERVAHLDAEKLKYVWMRWLREGLQ